MSSPAFAQWTTPYYGYGYGGYGGYGASTALEGQYRGYADALRAQGNNNRANAQATLKYEEARSKYIENRQKWMDTYLAGRRILIAERNQKEEEKRERIQRSAERRKSSPPRRRGLSPGEFDPTTGFVGWTDILLTRPYESDRNKVEELLLLHRHTRGRPEIGTDLDNTVKSMDATLNTQVGKYKSSQWSAAKIFLRELRIEIRSLIRR